MKLEEARKRIDAADEELVALFLERMTLSGEIARAKAEKGLDVLDPAREEKVLERVAAQSGDMAGYTVDLYLKILELSKAYQRTILSE